MWQCWAIFYIGLWILVSGYLFGGAMRLSNILFGGIIALLAFWAGMVSRRVRSKE